MIDWSKVITKEQRDAEALKLAEVTMTGELERLFDQTASQRGYDNRVTCALRAGFSGPFQAEGTAFAQWMDQCNMEGYKILNQVRRGEISIPSVEEFLAALPVLEWPASPIPLA